MSWLLNVAYGAILLLLSPVILYRNIRFGRYRRGWKQKLFGYLPQSPGDGAVVWFHAVSVGEVVQLQKVVEAFRLQQPDMQVLVTTSTDTGFDLAIQRFEGCTVSWFPLDFSWSVNTALQRVKPAMVVLMELELWPNFLRACESRKITTALVNARMSDRSFRGYSRVRPFVTSMFHSFAAVGAQSQEYADRLKALGCRTNAVHITGSVKFDGVQTDRNNSRTVELRKLLGIDAHEVVFMAGSTQDPEERMALATWEELRRFWPSLRLVLVPRHRERFDIVADMVTASGNHLCRRSTLTTPVKTSSDSVILLDTIGELSACWGVADIAFVGGSFGTRGGQNMLEPAAYGAAVLFGPNTWNFRDIVARLLSADAAVQVSETAEISPLVEKLLSDNDKRVALGDNAQSVVLSQQGAVKRTVQLLTNAQKTQALDAARSRAA